MLVKGTPGRHHGGGEGWGKGLGGSRRVGWGVGRWVDICNHQGYVRQHIARDQIVHVLLWFVTGRIYPHSSGLRHLHWYNYTMRKQSKTPWSYVHIVWNILLITVRSPAYPTVYRCSLRCLSCCTYVMSWVCAKALCYRPQQSITKHQPYA